MDVASSEAEAQSEPPSRVSVRAKTDPTWGYAVLNNEKINCTFCKHIIGGGGISRFKLHLAGVKGNVKAVPAYLFIFVKQC